MFCAVDFSATNSVQIAAYFYRCMEYFIKQWEPHKMTETKTRRPAIRGTYFARVHFLNQNLQMFAKNESLLKIVFYGFPQKSHLPLLCALSVSQKFEAKTRHKILFWINLSCKSVELDLDCVVLVRTFEEKWVRVSSQIIAYQLTRLLMQGSLCPKCVISNLLV